MHIERVKKAIETLKAVQARIDARERGVYFDMGSWGGRDGDEEEGFCGTTACAAGWMTVDPWHQSQGLKYFSRDDFEPVFGASHSTSAMTYYLEIPDEIAERIFINARSSVDTALRTPLDVANELSRLLAAELEQSDA